MLYISLGLFAVAALIGVLLLKSWLTNTATPRTTVYLHGVFAATALIVLLIQVLHHPAQGGLRTSLILFIIAALGGFILFFRDVNHKNSPVWIAFVHGLLAVAGFMFLLFTILK